jgi:hypothetical protein
MKCEHGREYPAEGPNGPWKCAADGSNPDCPECRKGNSPDSWAQEIRRKADF